VCVGGVVAKSSERERERQRKREESHGSLFARIGCAWFSGNLLSKRRRKWGWWCFGVLVCLGLIPRERQRVREDHGCSQDILN
jgi:hypothetical protein